MPLRSLVATLDMLEHQLPKLTNAGYDLTSQQRGVLTALRQHVALARKMT